MSEEDGDETVLYNVKIKRKMLAQLEAARKKGNYPTTSALVREALQEKVERIKNPESAEDDDWETQDTPDDKAFDKDEKALLDLIEEFSTEGDPIAEAAAAFTDPVEALQGFCEEAKKFVGKTALWGRPKVVAAFRAAVRDEVCPEQWMDGSRKPDPKVATKFTEVLRKKLKLPRSIAANLVQDPECHVCKSKTCLRSRQTEAESEEGSEEESEEEEEE